MPDLKLLGASLSEYARSITVLAMLADFLGEHGEIGRESLYGISSDP